MEEATDRARWREGVRAIAEGMSASGHLRTRGKNGLNWMMMNHNNFFELSENQQHFEDKKN